MVGALGLFLTVTLTVIGEPGQTVIVTDKENAAYQLADPLIVAGTDSVFLDGELLDRSEYFMDLDQGQVVFLKPIPEWTPVLVKYRYVRFPDPGPTLARPRPQIAPPTVGESVRVVTKLDTLAAAPLPGLELTGSKVLGFSVGPTAGLGLDQATRLNLQGAVEGIAIDAELSDQSSPIPPEGTTRNLEELDKLVINLRSRTWQGTFGDIELAGSAGNLGGINRQAVGAVLRGTVGQLSLSGGYARPKGQFGRVIINGSDGVQGPYVLAPDSRSAQLVPGTEAVYLDGRRLTRGWDADYTIDYATGELIFTNRHIITHLSRIEAEFQFVTEAYDRTALLGGAQFWLDDTLRSRPGPLALGITLFQERDDPNRVRGTELSEQERVYLAGIGSDTTRAWLPGGRFVGPGNGDYLLEGNHYRYVGRGAGDHLVQFTLKADSLGSYIYDDSLLAYRFVGPHQGNYVDSIKVALPERQDLVLARAGFNNWGLSALLDAAFRRQSLNLFTPGGASQDNGAFSLNAGWQDSTLELTYRHRSQGSGFELPGRSPNIDFAYQWGGTTEKLLATSDELLARIRVWDSVTVLGELGRLKRTDNQTVPRLAGRTQAWWLSYEAARAGAVTRQRVAATPAISWFFPSAEWAIEDNTGRRDITWLVGAATKPSENLSTNAVFRVTNNERSASGRWSRNATQQLVQAGITWALKEAFRLEGLVTHHTYNSNVPAEKNWRQILGAANVSASPVAGLRLQGDVSQSYRRVQLKDEQFRYVGPGQGSYRRDSITGGYLYDPEGDYERVLVATGRFTAAKELSASASADIAVLEPVSFTASFTKLRTTADTGLLSAAASYDLRSTIAPPEHLSVTIGATAATGLDRTLAATGKESRQFQEYLELASDRIPGLEARARLERTDGLKMASPTLIQSEEHSWRLELQPILGAELRLELTAGFERRLVAEPAGYPELGTFALNGWSSSIARTWPVSNHAKLRTTLGLVYRTATVSELPFAIGLESPLGLTPSAALELEQVFSEGLSASGSYNFFDRPDRKPEHRFSAELRAYF